jgi:hypothetical protein
MTLNVVPPFCRHHVSQKPIEVLILPLLGTGKISFSNRIQNNQLDVPFLPVFLAQFGGPRRTPNVIQAVSIFSQKSTDFFAEFSILGLVQKFFKNLTRSRFSVAILHFATLLKNGRAVNSKVFLLSRPAYTHDVTQWLGFEPITSVQCRFLRNASLLEGNWPGVSESNGFSLLFRESV